MPQKPFVADDFVPDKFVPDDFVSDDGSSEPFFGDYGGKTNTEQKAAYEQLWEMAKGAGESALGMAHTFLQGPEGGRQAGMAVANQIALAKDPKKEVAWALAENNPVIPITRGMTSDDPKTIARSYGQALPGLALGVPFLGPSRGAKPHGQRLLPEGRGPIEGESIPVRQDSIIEGEIVPPIRPEVRNIPDPTKPAIGDNELDLRPVEQVDRDGNVVEDNTEPTLTPPVSVTPRFTGETRKSRLGKTGVADFESKQQTLDKAHEKIKGTFNDEDMANVLELEGKNLRSYVERMENDSKFAESQRIKLSKPDDLIETETGILMSRQEALDKGLNEKLPGGKIVQADGRDLPDLDEPLFSRVEPEGTKRSLRDILGLSDKMDRREFFRRVTRSPEKARQDLAKFFGPEFHQKVEARIDELGGHNLVNEDVDKFVGIVEQAWKEVANSNPKMKAMYDVIQRGYTGAWQGSLMDIRHEQNPLEGQGIVGRIAEELMSRMDQPKASTVSSLRSQIQKLDTTTLNDIEYKKLIPSTAQGSLKSGETWRSRALKLADIQEGKFDQAPLPYQPDGIRRTVSAGEMKTVWDEMHPIDLQGHRETFFHDAGGKLTPDEVTGLQNNPKFRQLAEFYDRATNEILSRVAWGNTIKRTFLVFDDKLNGVWIPEVNSESSAIGLNPFEIFLNDFNPQRASEKALIVAEHEAAHGSKVEGKPALINLGKQDSPTLTRWSKLFGDEKLKQLGKDEDHDVSFISRLGEIHAALGPTKFFELANELKRIAADESGRNYPEFQNILQLYQTSRWRGSTRRDYLSRAGVKSENSGQVPEGTVPNDTTGSGTGTTKRTRGKGSNKLQPGETLDYAKQRVPILLAKKRLNVSENKELGRLVANYKNELLGATGGSGGGNVPPPRPPNSTSSTIPPPDSGGNSGPTGRTTTANARPLQKSSNLLELWNLSRGLKTIWDFSAPLRQGLGLIHKKEFWTSLDDMFAAFGSEQAYQGIMNEIFSRPNYIPGKGQAGSFAKQAGLDLSDLMTRREENLISKWADKVPGGRRSNRAYTAFLNRLRADVFDSLIRDNPEARTNPVLAKGLADFVNTASGRGSLGAAEKAGHILNQFLFSPKLIASRVQMLNPHYYITAHPKVRMEALKSLAAIAATGMTVAGLGKLAGGEVSLDPTSSDFGKVKLGNIRLDPWGGFQQYIVAFARMGKAFDRQVIEGKKPKQFQSMFDISDRFRRFKMHPSWGFAEDMARGYDFKGDRPKYPQAVLDLYTPMIAEDMMKLYQEDPRAVGLAIPEAFGMGVSVQEK